MEGCGKQFSQRCLALPMTYHVKLHEEMIKYRNDKHAIKGSTDQHYMYKGKTIKCIFINQSCTFMLNVR